MKEKVYIGGYSNNIKICEFNNGNLKIVNEIKSSNNPSYLAINKNMLYAVSETKIGGIDIFKITQNNLQKVEEKVINQSLPCYIEVDEKQKNMLVANYGSGSVILYNLKKDGTINRQKHIESYKNANMHFASFVQNNIYTVDLANNNIYIYNQKMELLTSIKTGIKTGPRHFAISKDKKMLYVVTEISNEVYVYEKQNNKFELLQKISTLTDKKIKSYAGAIKISKNNKNIYVTNRGHNSISVFAIKQKKLEPIQNVPSYGDFPRDIELNENEQYAMVANQNSNNIVIYKRNLKTRNVN